VLSSVIPILLAEDCPEDAFLLELAFNKAKCPWQICHVHDGDDAMNYIAGLGKYDSRAKYPFPKVVLLDIKMPKANGFEVLSWIRQRPELNGLPVVILTGSCLEKDRLRAMELGASAFFTKTPRSADIIHYLSSILGVPCESMPAFAEPVQTV